MFQSVYYDVPSKSVSQIEPHRFFRSLRRFDPILSSQKPVQLGGLDISFAGPRRDYPGFVRRFLLRAIAISEVTARDQKDRQHNQQAERVVLPRSARVRPEEDVFYSDKDGLHKRSTTPSKRKRVIDGACSSKFRIHARKKLPGTDCLRPADYRVRANPAPPLSYRHIADSDGRVLDMETIKQLQRFYVAEVFQLQPLIPCSQGSETISLPNGTSAIDQRQCTTRVNRKFVEGISPAIPGQN